MLRKPRGPNTRRSVQMLGSGTSVPVEPIRPPARKEPLGLAAPTPGLEPTDPPWVARGYGGTGGIVAGRQWATCRVCLRITLYRHGQGNFPGRPIEHEDDCTHRNGS